MSWHSDYPAFNETSWSILKIELDKITYNRFTPFFCKQVRCCEPLLKLWKPLIVANLKAIDKSLETIVTGVITSTDDVSVNVGGVSYTQKGKNVEISILPTLVMLLDRYSLRYPQPRIDNYCCGKCEPCKNPCDLCQEEEC